MTSNLDKLFGAALRQEKPPEEELSKEIPVEESSVEEIPVEEAAGESAESAELPDASSIPRDNALCELEISQLDDFPEEQHPFRPYTQERLEALRQDIIERGIIQPLIVRPLAGRYQIISGHNRRTAARNAGYTALPCIIRQLDDDEALLQMISTNLQQRQDLYPSEKAFAYKMQLDALKHQGARTDLTSPHGAAKFRSDDAVAEADGISGDTVRRYIRLTYLIPSLLDMVDEKKLGFTIGETLSYLSAESQQIVDNFFFTEQHLGIDQRAADKLRELEEAGELTDDRLRESLFGAPAKPPRKIRVEYKTIRKYFKADTTEKEIQETIQAALKFYFSNSH